MEYAKMNKTELAAEYERQKQIYADYMAKNLSYDMTRGKPAATQLDLSEGMLDPALIGDGKGETGIDYRNYGLGDGIPEAKRLFGEIFHLSPEHVFVSGNSSLNIMHDLLARFLLFGTNPGMQPWKDAGSLKFLCPVPGYDRHFAITELFGFEMINIPLLDDGPDMDLVERLVAEDASIKGMWAIPKYSNPTGTVYSEKVLRRMASMKTAAEDFRILCDDAYTVHFLGDKPVDQLNLIRACEEAGNPNRTIMFASTSKITFPGAGISAMASGVENIKYFTKLIGYQTIGADKMNQLRHVKFLHDYEGILSHMRKHAALIAPKFQVCQDVLSAELADADILKWTKPEGGYFISIDTVPGCAARVVALAKACGVAVTPAGSTFPYRKDPNDCNIRLAPTFPPVEQLKEAMQVLCVCIKMATLEKLMAE